MNFRNVFDSVKSRYNLDFDIEEITDKKILITCRVNLKGIDDSIYMRVVAYESGSVTFLATFDHLDRTLENFAAVNEFNEWSGALLGYISEKKGGDYFELMGTSIGTGNCSESDIASIIRFFIGKLADDEVIAKLQPICRRTY